MPQSMGIFILQIGLAGLAFCGGFYLGKGPKYRATLCIFISVGLLLTWAWLTHHPAVAVEILSARVLRYIEGTAAAPIFMLIVGAIWSSTNDRRHRRLAGWATALAAIYFINGGAWMIQSTPQVGFADTLTNTHKMVYQSQEFSCVPASCATALNMIDLPTTEAEMAILTDTRPGTGATLIRAMDGLQQRLEMAGRDEIKVRLIEPKVDQLRMMPLPAVTPLRLEASRHHMVTIVRVNAGGVWIADPVDGMIYMPNGVFERNYTGRVLVFER